MANTATSSRYPTIPTGVILRAVDNGLLRVLKDREDATPEPESDDEDVKNYRPPYDLFCEDHRRDLGRDTVDDARHAISDSGYWKAEAQQYLGILVHNASKDTCRRPGPVSACPWRGIVYLLVASLQLLGYDAAETADFRESIRNYGYWQSEMAAIELYKLRKEYDSLQPARTSPPPRHERQDRQAVSPHPTTNPSAAGTSGCKRKRDREGDSDSQRGMVNSREHGETSTKRRRIDVGTNPQAASATPVGAISGSKRKRSSDESHEYEPRTVTGGRKLLRNRWAVTQDDVLAVKRIKSYTKTKEATERRWEKHTMASPLVSEPPISPSTTTYAGKNTALNQEHAPPGQQVRTAPLLQRITRARRRRLSGTATQLVQLGQHGELDVQEVPVKVQEKVLSRQEAKPTFRSSRLRSYLKARRLDWGV